MHAATDGTACEPQGIAVKMPAMKDAHYPGFSPTMSPAAARHRLRCLAGSRAIAVLLLALLTACGGKDNVRGHAPAQPERKDWPAVQPADPEAANSVLMRAIGLVGTPYRYGGNTPESGFDCSGLVTYVYRDMLDLRLPRTSSELAEVQGPRIAPEKLAAADLVFFGSRGKVSHVGIYVGEGRFVHAPSTGGTVRLDRLDGQYWRDHYTGAKRVLR